MQESPGFWSLNSGQQAPLFTLGTISLAQSFTPHAAVLGTEPRALHTLGRNISPEPHIPTPNTGFPSCLLSLQCFGFLGFVFAFCLFFCGVLSEWHPNFHRQWFIQSLGDLRPQVLLSLQSIPAPGPAFSGQYWPLTC